MPTTFTVYHLLPAADSPYKEFQSDSDEAYTDGRASCGTHNIASLFDLLPGEYELSRDSDGALIQFTVPV